MGAERRGGSYGAAKTALAARNASLSAESAPRDVTCNVISPGYIAGSAAHHRTDDQRRRRRVRHPLSRRWPEQYWFRLRRGCPAGSPAGRRGPRRGRVPPPRRGRGPPAWRRYG
ncbi:SDR family oxidoreductase [Streptomyces sp. NPDC102406]|uniref:SDR family oxidoreductase n=1 Tax=Streptomyces sp. NPDC102406 TaxID=3366171 RepID=UPI0037FF6259